MLFTELVLPSSDDWAKILPERWPQRLAFVPHASHHSYILTYRAIALC